MSKHGANQLFKHSNLSPKDPLCPSQENLASIKCNSGLQSKESLLFPHVNHPASPVPPILLSGLTSNNNLNSEQVASSGMILSARHNTSESNKPTISAFGSHRGNPVKAQAILPSRKPLQKKSMSDYHQAVNFHNYMKDQAFLQQPNHHQTLQSNGNSQQ